MTVGNFLKFLMDRPGRTVGMMLLLSCTISAALPAAATPETIMLAGPPDGLVDVPFFVRILNAKPHSDIKISSRFLDEKTPSQAWTAVGEFRADDHGSVDTRISPSTNGTYIGVVPGGLACSALPVPVAEISDYLEKIKQVGGRTVPLLDAQRDFTVEITATVNGVALTPQKITRRYLAKSINVHDVNEGRVRGQYYEAAGETHGIPVVVIAGSGGGLMTGDAELLASHGHPVLALAYFNYQDLKKTLTKIPIETFADGAAWLAAKTGVPRVVIMGASRGTEAVQLTGGFFPEHIAGIIAEMPSPLVHGGVGPDAEAARTAAWTIGGVDVPFFAVSDSEYTRVFSDVSGRTPPGLSESLLLFNSVWQDPSVYHFYATPLDRINVPMLLIGAGRDAMWPSAFGAQKIKERMTALGKGGLVEMHIYPDAGHHVREVGIASEISATSVNRFSGVWTSTGGKPEANCEGGYASFREILRFLDKF